MTTIRALELLEGDRLGHRGDVVTKVKLKGTRLWVTTRRVFKHETRERLRSYRYSDPVRIIE